MKFGRVVVQVNTYRLTNQIFDLMSHFEGGQHFSLRFLIHRPFLLFS